MASLASLENKIAIGKWEIKTCFIKQCNRSSNFMVFTQELKYD